ncbi:hypothetical protein HKBW3S06_01713, partial [Candidatus Hakubella thermalkaliphila]
MRVCFVSNSSQIWGAERSMLELIDGLRGKGVTCFVFLPKHGSLINELKNRGVG